MNIVEGEFKWWFGERMLGLYSASGYCGGEDVEVVKEGELFTFTG